MEFSTLLPLLERLGCRSVNTPHKNRVLVSYRWLDIENYALREDILYLGREADFKIRAFRECYCGIVVPEALSMDEVYQKLDSFWATSMSELIVCSKLTAALWNGMTLQQIVDIASELLGNPVSISNYIFLPIVDSKAVSLDSSQISLKEGFLQELRSYNGLQPGRQRDGISINAPNFYAHGGHQWLLGAVKIGKIIVAWIALPDIFHPFCDRDFELIKTLCNIISTYFVTENSFNPKDQRTLDIFLRDLIAGNYANNEAVETARGQISAMNYNRYCMIAVRWNGGTPDNNMINAVLQQMRVLMPNNPAIFHERYFAILLAEEQGASEKNDINFALREFLAINGLQAAVSQPFSDLKESRRYFEQAADTLEAVANLYQDELLIHYGEHLIVQMIHAFNKNDDICRFRHSAFEILENYDAQNDTELARTLSTYLDLNCSPSRTYQALFIHRNTLAKRLQKISDLTGADLNNNRTITQLTVANAIGRYLRSQGR